jgi:hypothetical protein
MKNKLFLATVLFVVAFSRNLNAQEASKKSCAVLNVEATESIRKKIPTLDNLSAGTTVRRELEKLAVYEVAFRQDMQGVVSREKLEMCFDISCMHEVGTALKVEKVVSGAIEYVEGSIVVALRELDVATRKVSNSRTKEFRFLPEQLKYMVQITLQEMYGLPVDDQMLRTLENQFGREEFANNPGVDRLNLSGFRVGAVGIFGDNATVLTAPRNEGGFDVRPFMFQFGYQFETQYLNQGRLQALFEFIPVITGIEQGLFIPTISILHGIRDNKTGLEFAFGATVGLSRMAEGYFDNGSWKLEKDFVLDTMNTTPMPALEWRLDSRGEFRPYVGFIAAAGFSLRSGNLNIPMNVFAVTQRNSFRLGLSVGINGRGRRGR